MSSHENSGIDESTMVMGYDDYLGRFVDDVQHDTTAFRRLLDTWLSSCPDGWRERFETDTAEIATLIEDGVFGKTVDAA